MTRVFEPFPIRIKSNLIYDNAAVHVAVAAGAMADVSEERGRGIIGTLLFMMSSRPLSEGGPHKYFGDVK